MLEEGEGNRRETIVGDQNFFFVSSPISCNDTPDDTIIHTKEIGTRRDIVRPSADKKCKNSVRARHPIASIVSFGTKTDSLKRREQAINSK